MDEFERMILRRKKHLLLGLPPFRFTITMQKQLRSMNLLNDDMIPHIASVRCRSSWRGNSSETIYIHQMNKKLMSDEQDERSQMSRYLDVLMRVNPGGDAFFRLCELLEQEDYSWVAHEMRADVLAERGDIEIEDYIRKECAMIIHREFGTSKLIPEDAKARMTHIMSLRAQAMKESSEVRLHHLAEDLHRAMTFQCDEETKIKMLIDKIATFLKIHKIKLNEYVTDQSAADNMRTEMESKKPCLDGLEDTVDHLLNLFARVNLESDKLNDERAKSYKVLGVQKGAIALDLAIRSTLINAAEDIKNSQRQVDVTEEMANQLDVQLRNSELVLIRESEAKDRQIAYLEKQLAAKKERNHDMEDEINKLRKLLSDAEYELEKIKRDIIVLKKIRHLGYIGNLDDVGEQALLMLAAEEKVENGGPGSEKFGRKDSRKMLQSKNSGSPKTVTAKQQPLNRRNTDQNKALLKK